MAFTKIPLVLVHIGLPKTGSTSLQQALYEDRRNLLKNGYFYADLETDFHHWPLQMPFVHQPSKHHLIRKRGLTEAESMNFIREKIHDFQRQLSQSNAHTCILSSEGFSDIPLDKIDQFRDFLQRMFHKTVIIVYKRDSVSGYLSELNERMKQGTSLSNLPFPKSYVIHQEQVIQRFVRCFGEDAIRHQAYVVQRFVNQDIVQDFYHQFLLKDDAKQRAENFSIPTTKRANVGLPIQAAIILSLLSEVVPPILSSGSNPQWRFLQNAVSSHFNQEPLITSKKLLLPQHWIEQLQNPHNQSDLLPITQHEMREFFKSQIDTSDWMAVINGILQHHQDLLVHILANQASQNN